MAQQYPYNWKQCATCAYWSGQRSTNTFGEYVEVDSAMSKGKCLHQRSGWHNQDKQANASCQSFEKWAPLK